MTPDQWRDLYIVGMIVAILSTSMFVALRYLYRTYRNDALNQFHTFLDENSPDEGQVTIFTVDHITWSEISLDEVEKRLSRSCLNWYLDTVVPIPTKPNFAMNADGLRNAVYIVFGQKREFDWKSVAHYEDYVLGTPNE